MKKILQLGGSFHQSFFIEELIKNDYHVDCLDNVPDNPGHYYAKNSYNISITDIDKIKKIITNENYIISSYGSDIAEISRNILLGETGNHLKLFEKHSARMFLKKVFINQRQPDIKIADFKEDKLKNSCVIKPNISSGSKGVFIINSSNKIRNAINIARNISKDGVAILEEYINNDGNKYYCEGLIINNNILLVYGCSKSSTQSLTWDGSSQITENNISLYTNMSYKEIFNLLKVCIMKLSKAISKDSFAFNIDFFINGKEIVIIEFATRPGGNLLPLVLEHSYNINYSLTYLSILKGNPKIIYRKIPFLPIVTQKAINISISANKTLKDKNQNNEDNMVTFKRPSSKNNSHQLAALIYGS
tara:strand:+ start:565 stop:1647 length:1083 start_codon:yes stop_codon:yes gene_type:complete